MKTILRILSLITAASVPGLAFAEFAGAHLPAGFDAVTALAVFVSSTLALIALIDYARRGQPIESVRERPLRPALPTASTARPSIRLAA